MKRIITFILMVFCLSSANTLSEIQTQKIIRVGAALNLPPFSKLVNGKFEGFEVELANAIAKNIFKNGAGKIELIGMEAKDRIDNLNNNKVDMVIRMMSVNDKRKKLVDFSTPYLTVNTAILTNKKDNISDISKLKGQKVLVKKGSSAIKKIQEAGIESLICISAAQCYEKLKMVKL